MTNEEVRRDMAWLDTWVETHPTARAAARIRNVLAALGAMDSSTEPVEPGVPVRETAEKYLRIKGEVLSRIPHGSLWDKIVGDEAKIDNFFLHLYNEHKLGCVECFGGSDRV